MRHLRDVDLRGRGDAVAAADRMIRRSRRANERAVGELLGQRAVEAARARHAALGALRLGSTPMQVVGAAVDPARVAVGDQVGDLGRRRA